MDDPEPAENISGGTSAPSAFAEFTSGEPATRAEAVVDRLGDRYWQKTYGGQDAFECLVRTVLSQNTSDVASQPAHDALMDRYGGEDADSGGEDTDSGGGTERDLAVALAGADHNELADTIRPAGLYNQKTTVLMTVAERVLDGHGSAEAFDRFVREGDPAEVRDSLLDLKGVGPKTADCVLLFAGGQSGVFPVDTHVHRIFRRLGIAPADADHEEVRAVLERDVPAGKCGFGHTATIQFGREYCTARKPACLDGVEGCPMSDLCDRVGVDVESGTVTDPADAD
ncbi:endonuclease III domain-containing protein [Halorussus amylolyticus]|uniref:endonuclease III domain-containing protein n=1 Tax=Halorussus amylolyticus TaxID=1126242 RepID=UPI0010509837|nr:endonuclease III [Halorussus amylolyticus]